MRELDFAARIQSFIFAFKSGFMNDVPRHLLATFAYRLIRACKNAPASFADFNPGSGVRTPVQILYHLRSVLCYGIYILNDEKQDYGHQGDFQSELDGILSTASRLDALLAEREYPSDRLNRMLQGPLADVLTHVGQLSMLRRMEGTAVEGMNFTKVEIEAGKLYY